MLIAAISIKQQHFPHRLQKAILKWGECLNLIMLKLLRSQFHFHIKKKNTLQLYQAVKV